MLESGTVIDLTQKKLDYRIVKTGHMLFDTRNGDGSIVDEWWRGPGSSPSPPEISKNKRRGKIPVRGIVGL